jgi:hypothetical protein
MALKKTPPLVELDTLEAERLLDEWRTTKEFTARITRISAHFINHPYLENPLGGGPHEKEVLRLTLAGFDCVTYMETALAFAAARTAKDFIAAVRRLRYANGEVDWYHRNHYMFDWAKNNEARGAMQNITDGPQSVTITRPLAVIKELPAKVATFNCFPKRRLARVLNRIETGDLILFASTHKWLDVFHTGILIKTDGDIRLRHATRTAGKVIEQPLKEFLTSHRMAGFILLRPLCQR